MKHRQSIWWVAALVTLGAALGMAAVMLYDQQSTEEENDAPLFI